MSLKLSRERCEDRIKSEHTSETNLANYCGADGKDGLLELLFFENPK